MRPRTPINAQGLKVLKQGVPDTVQISPAVLCLETGQVVVVRVLLLDEFERPTPLVVLDSDIEQGVLQNRVGLSILHPGIAGPETFEAGHDTGFEVRDGGIQVVLALSLIVSPRRVSEFIEIQFA